MSELKSKRIVGKYPLNLGNKPRIKFTTFEVVTLNIKEQKQQIKEKIKESIILSLPNELTDTLGQNWTEGTAYKVDASKGWKQASLSAGKMISQEASKKLSGMLGDVIQNSTSYSLRKSINPHTEILYNGPQFRTFTFSWTFQPTSEKETREIKNIIRFLKEHSLPESSTTGFGTLDLMNYPDIFKIEIIPGGLQSTTNFITFKDCVIENITTNYAPEGTVLLLKNGMPASINLSIQVKEIKWIMRSDYIKSNAL